MRALEFILILILILVICAMAGFTRWYITVDGEWSRLVNKPGAAIESEQAPGWDMYAELPVTRIEFLVLLEKKLGLEQENGPVDFTDIPPGSITTRYIYPALKAGLVSGYPDNTFRPYELITKNEAEIIMSKALNRPVPPWYENSTYLTWKQMLFMMTELDDEKNKR
jgi:hypothetical protein